MATSRLFLALPLLASAAFASAQLPGPYRWATARFSSYDADFHPLNDVADQAFQADDPLNPPTGPLTYDREESFAYGSSNYTGTARATLGYGTMGLYARTVLQDQENGAAYNETIVDGQFFDPLTISGGAFGDTLHLAYRLTASVDEVGLDGAGLAWAEELTLYVADPDTDTWVSAPNQSIVRTGGGDRYGIDETAVTTLTNFDPSKRYALSGYARLIAIRRAGRQPGYADGSTTIDATHTAQIVGMGFVGANGELTGRFEGLAGGVYAEAVPEPATLLALGGGLALLRRRRQVARS